MYFQKIWKKYTLITVTWLFRLGYKQCWGSESGLRRTASFRKAGSHIRGKIRICIHAEVKTRILIRPHTSQKPDPDPYPHQSRIQDLWSKGGQWSLTMEAGPFGEGSKWSWARGGCVDQWSQIRIGYRIRIHIKSRSRIRISIKMKSLIRIRIKVKRAIRIRSVSKKCRSATLVLSCTKYVEYVAAHIAFTDILRKRAATYT